VIWQICGDYMPAFAKVLSGIGAGNQATLWAGASQGAEALRGESQRDRERQARIGRFEAMGNAE